eukprot:TRINITY_DN6943_c1_g8_i1.p1 TRINITY_DN6943_c1_g8~~TRINITY_DN6943_c1_g8_i1.p1  ORF type:complete len:156 (+),score=37.86 TRINITY_DN6943_c1_g8_i1:620-1087(+)
MIVVNSVGKTKIVQFPLKPSTPSAPTPNEGTFDEGSQPENSKNFDSWNFGFVLYEVLTGHTPYHDMDLPDASFQLLTNGLPREVPEFSPELKDFFSACFATPSERKECHELLRFLYISKYKDGTILHVNNDEKKSTVAESLRTMLLQMKELLKSP